MASRTWTSPHRAPWQRLLALLLVLSFAIATLPSHAAADACQVDCAQLQGERLDTEDCCGTACAAPVASPRPVVLAPHSLPLMVALAMSDHVPPPPRRPPRA